MKRINIINGIPYFEVDGEIVVPAAYMTYFTENADYKAFSRAGFTLYSIGVRFSEFAGNEETGLNGGFTPQTWISEDEYDFSSLDSDIAKLIEETGNKNAKIILRINLNMPGWWREKYPEELTLFDNGQTLMQSISSKRWREDGGRYLCALKRHIEAAGYVQNVIAWQPAAMHTEEWFAPIDVAATEDFSVPAQNEFREFCRKKYGTIQALNAAWNTTYKLFEDIYVPTKIEREENGERAKDYFRYKNDAYAETADYFCGYIKKLFDGDIFVGCFGGYIGQLTKKHGHCSFSKLLQSKNIDFFASPFAYTQFRGKSVDWIYHSAIESCRRAGKLWFIEADVRTHRTKLLSECAPWLFDRRIAYYEENPVWKGPDKQNSLWNILRSFSKVFISRNAFWWFDMWGGWYKNKEYAALIKKTYELYAKETGKKIESASEVAVILDETCSYYVTENTYWKAVYDQIVSLGYLGSPYDLLLLQGLKEEDVKRYKVAIFLAPAPLNENETLINSLRASGKTVLVSGDETGRYGGVAGRYGEEEMQEYLTSGGVHIYCAGNIVYANEKYLSVTARKDGTLLVKMPHDCEFADCITQEKYRTVDRAIALEAESNQTFLFEIIR